MAGRGYLLLLAMAAIVVACPGGGTPAGSGGAGGTGGAGGCPDDKPMAAFALSVTASDGPVPADLQLDVKWSADTEPPFSLDDPSTYGSLDKSNVICNVGSDAPQDLDVLRCDLWTTGATEITLRAAGYDEHGETLEPLAPDACDQRVTKKVDIELAPEMAGRGK
jgi:hypothetical protein